MILFTPNEHHSTMLSSLRFLSIFVFCAYGLCMSSCFEDKTKHIPDVSNIITDLKFREFEKDMFSLDTMNTIAGMHQLDSLYPGFFRDIYLAKIIPALQNPQIFDLFVKTPQIRQLYDTTQIVLGNFTPYKNDLDQAFKFYKYHFPDAEIPEIITFISEYSLGNFVADGMVGIGLDFFLGSNYPRYNPSFFPAYIRRSMNPEHLVSKTMDAVASDLVGEIAGDRLIDYMIHNGKKYYVLDLLLPHTADSLLLQYSGTQVEWLEKNELQIWSHLIGEDLLYSTRYKDIRKLVDYSPNAPGMPSEAPGRTANWLGWNIVKAYMKRHPEVTPAELLKLTDSQKILDGSKYKPRR